MMKAASLIAYVGDGTQFLKTQKLRNYIGLVSMVDQSGNSTTSAGYHGTACKIVRKIFIQGALNVEKKVWKDCTLKAMATKMRMNGEMQPEDCCRSGAQAADHRVVPLEE